MSNLKRILSALLAVLMVMGMFSCLSTVGWARGSIGDDTNPYEHFNNNWDLDFDQVNQDNSIKSYAQLLQEYNGDPFWYLGIEVYEEADETTPGAINTAGGYWVLTDHYVSRGDNLLVRYYVKSNMYTPGFNIFYEFSRRFFNIAPGSNLTYNPTSDYTVTGYAKDGLPNKGYPGSSTPQYLNPLHAINQSHPDKYGQTVAHIIDRASNATAMKNSANGMDQVNVASWDYIDYVLTLSGGDGSSIVSMAPPANSPTDADVWFAQNIIKVRDGNDPVATGGTGANVADDAVGYIGYDLYWDTAYGRRATGGINTSFTDGVRTGLVSAAKHAYNGDAYYDNADCNHIFKIGTPSAGNSAKFYDGETEYTSYAQNGLASGAIVDLTNQPTKAGYKFLGWALKNDNTNSIVNFYQMAGADVEFKAVWGHTVTFMNGANVFSTVDVADGASVSAPANDPTNAAAAGFLGWYASTDSNKALVSFPATPTADVTYNAKYSYTATFDPNGGAFDDATYAGSEAVAEGAAIPFPAVSKAGATLDGWLPADSVMPAAAATYTAQWTTTGYAVTYDLAGGSFDNANDHPTSLALGDNLPAPAVSKLGHNFGGWTYTTTAGGAPVTGTMPAEAITATATWTANTYNAVFMIDGVQTPYATVPTEFGQQIAMPDLPSEDGYDFSEWAVTSGSQGTVMDSEGKTFTTTKTAKLIDVQFQNKDGDSLGNQAGARFGDAVQFPSAPPVTGMNYIGWNRTTEDGTVFIAAADTANETVPAKAVVYKAVYEGNKHTATFKVDGQTISTQEIGYGATIVFPAVTPATGYKFDGWTYNGAPVTSGMAMEDNDMTFEGTTSKKTITISFDANGGSDVASVSGLYGDPVPAIGTTTMTGYTFAGWDAAVPTTFPAEDLTLNAVWTINTWNLTYVLYDSEQIVVPYEYGATIAKIGADDPRVERTGYTFNGWDPAEPNTMPDSNVTVEALWNQNTYYLEYWRSVDGTENRENRYSMHYGDVIPEEPLPTQEGYTFGAWSPALPATMPANDLKIVSTATKNVWHDIWYDIDGSIAYEQDVAYGDPIPNVELPTHAGYENPYWAPRMTTQPDRAVEFTYTAAAGQSNYKYTVKLEQLDGTYSSTTETLTGTTGNTANAGNNLDKNGYTLDTDNSVTSVTITADGNAEIILIYNLKEYNFVVTDNSGTTTTTYKYTAPISEPTAADKEGYTFSSWKYTRDNSSTSIALPATMPYYNINAEAQYTKNSYNVIAMVDYADGEGFKQLSSVSTPYGDPIASVAAPSQTGYAFSGWKTDANLGTDYTFGGNMPANDVVIYGAFTVNDYSFTFYTSVNGVQSAEPVYTLTQAYGTEIDAAAVRAQMPTIEGSAFSRFSPALPATMPAENRTVLALYGVSTLTVTYKDGDTVLRTFDVKYGDPVPTIDNPTKVGYSFNAWDNEIPATMPANDLVFTAQWTVLSFNAVFKLDANDTDAYATVNDVEFNTQFAAPAEEPRRDNYFFRGWKAVGASEAATFPYTMSTEGITFVAIWEQDPSACRVKSVVLVDADHYFQRGAAHYLVSVSEPAYSIKLIIDGKTQSFSKGSYFKYKDTDPGISGIYNIYTDTETGYEVWDIELVLDAGTYKAYCQTMDGYITESEANAREFTVAYADRANDDAIISSDIADDNQSAVVSGTKVVRGDYLTWTIKTSKRVTWLKLNDQYTLKSGEEKNFDTLFKYTNSGGAVTVTDDADKDERTWTVRMRFTYSGEDTRVNQNWTVFYKTGATSEWVEFNSEPIVIVVCYDQAATIDTATEYEKYTLVSAVPTNTEIAKGTRDVITVVTTDDCDKVRVTYGGKKTSFTTTSTNVEMAEGPVAGTITWLINYKYATVSDATSIEDNVEVQTRGNAWGDAVTFRVEVV